MEPLSKTEFNSNTNQSNPLSGQGIEILLKQLPFWKVLEIEDEKQLARQFTFKDFKQALFFVQKIGELAETFNHHPSICLEWGKVSVNWWTHSIGGLHQNDFVMAYKTQKIYADLN